MKRTTKIFIGVFGAVLLLSIFVIIYMSYLYDDKYNKSLKLEQKQIMISESSEYKVIIFETEEPVDLQDRYALAKQLSGQIQIKKSGDGKKSGNFSMPEALCLFTKTTISNDTLRISLNHKELLSHYYNGWGISLSKLSGLDFTVYADSSVDMVNRISGIDILFKGLELDKVNAETYYSSVVIDSCHFSRLSTLRMGSYLFNMEQSTIDTLDIGIDNDYLNIDNVKGCDINVMNLTELNKAGGHIYIEIPDKFCNTLNWYPKNKGSNLRLLVNSTQTDSTKLIFP